MLLLKRFLIFTDSLEVGCCCCILLGESSSLTSPVFLTALYGMAPDSWSHSVKPRQCASEGESKSSGASSSFVCFGLLFCAGAPELMEVAVYPLLGVMLARLSERGKSFDNETLLDLCWLSLIAVGCGNANWFSIRTANPVLLCWVGPNFFSTRVELIQCLLSRGTGTKLYVHCDKKVDKKMYHVSLLKFVISLDGKGGSYGWLKHNYVLKGIFWIKKSVFVEVIRALSILVLFSKFISSESECLSILPKRL